MSTSLVKVAVAFAVVAILGSPLAAQGSRALLDSATIAESGARTLAELLAARVPGVGVTYRTGAPGMAAQVTVRGSVGFSGSGRPALIVDGVLVRDDLLWIGETPDGHALADHWNLPVEEIASVEVILGASGGMALELGASRGAVLVTTHRPSGDPWRARVFADLRSVGAGTAIRPASTRSGNLSGGGTTYYCTLQAEVAGDCTPTGPWTHAPFAAGSPFAGGQRLRGGLSAAGRLPLGLRGRVAVIADSDPGALGSPIGRTDFAAILALPQRGRWQSDLDFRVQRVAGDFLGYRDLRRAATYGPFNADSSLDPRLTIADATARAPDLESFRTSVGSRSRLTLGVHTALDLRVAAERLTRESVRLFRGTHPVDGSGTYVDAFASSRDLWSVALEATDRRTVGRFELRSTAAVLRNQARQSEDRNQRFVPDLSPGTGGLQAFDNLLDGHTQRLSVRVSDVSGLSVGAGLRREGKLGDPALATLPHADVRWGWTPSATSTLSRLDVWTAYGESIDLQSFNDAVIRAFPVAAPTDIERTREWEVGAELGLFGDAATLGARAFRRYVDDAVILQPSFDFTVPYRLGFGGAIEARGSEVFVQLQRGLGARGRLVSRFWVSLARSEYGDGPPSAFLVSVGGVQGLGMFIQPGTAVGEATMQRRIYDDADANGVLETDELGAWVVAERGSLLPTRTFGASVHAERGRLQLGATFEGRAGHVRPRTDGLLCLRACPAIYDPNATLDEQAEALARVTTLVDAGFVRMRELWLRWRVADGRFGDVSLSVVGQNLLTWAATGGEDPETGESLAGGIAVGFYQQPIAPSLGLRLDIGAGVPR